MNREKSELGAESRSADLEGRNPPGDLPEVSKSGELHWALIRGGEAFDSILT